jgi:tetratricopeptide (TPR) repeat protein
MAGRWRSGPIRPTTGGGPAVERALGHYDATLTFRPRSFWGHYRAATAGYALGRPAEAAHHLARCLERRPGNAQIQAELAGCLFALQNYPEALRACDLALERAPDFAEFYRNRIYARLSSRQFAGLEDDLQRFETLSRVLPPELRGGAMGGGPPQDVGSAASVLRGLVDRRIGPGAGRGAIAEVGPAEIEARANIAESLRRAGLFPLAGAEAEKILLIRPDHIPSLMIRAELAIAARRFDAARADLDAVLGHPRLADQVCGYNYAFAPFHRVTELYLKAGQTGDALRVAEGVRDVAISPGFRGDKGSAHYILARVYAVLGATDPPYLVESAKQLYRAFIAHPDNRRVYAQESPWFDPVRVQIDAALARMEDPEAVRRRLVSAMARPAARVGDR